MARFLSPMCCLICICYPLDDCHVVPVYLFLISLISEVCFPCYLGNVKKCKHLLLKAVECSAVPPEMLETALQNFHLNKKQLLSDEEKENLTGNCNSLKYWLGLLML